MAEPSEHHIDDYRSPRLPAPLRAVNALGGPATRAWIRLDEASLLAAARKRTGLAKVDDEGFRKSLGGLLREISEGPALSPVGRLMTRALFVQLLSTRLRAEELWRRHPEILELPVDAPIVILGLPRTGTTHLHSLISQDPGLRSLPYYESLEPIPADPELGTKNSGKSDPRIRRCEGAVRFIHYAMPLFPLMHEMAPHAVHEEVQLLALDFSTMLFEASYQVPGYRDWYLERDQSGSYRFLRKMLQTLQWLEGAPERRWILKSPQHLEQIGPLLAAFPDARIVQPHRDPVRATASFCTMGAYTLRMNYGPIDPQRVGHYWADRIERMLNASVEDRHLVPEGRVFDVPFHEFMQDDLAMVERIYAFAGQPMTDDARAAMVRYVESHRRGRMGRVRYDLADFGLDPAERRAALRHYQERFDVPDE